MRHFQFNTKTITAAVGALVILGLAWGFLTQEQATAVTGAVTILLGALKPVAGK